MLTLTLVRHAKSDWEIPQLSDHERPLNRRGEKNARMMARRFLASGTPVDRILSSTAVRAALTAKQFAKHLELDAEFDDELYHSSASTMKLKIIEAEVSSVLLVAHDPGITNLAEQLSRGGIFKMPTCAVATFNWQATDWKTIDWNEPREWSFSTPR